MDLEGIFGNQRRQQPDRATKRRNLISMRNKWSFCYPVKMSNLKYQAWVMRNQIAMMNLTNQTQDKADPGNQTLSTGLTSPTSPQQSQDPPELTTSLMSSTCSSTPSLQKVTRLQKGRVAEPQAAEVFRLIYTHKFANNPKIISQNSFSQWNLLFEIFHTLFSCR